MEGQVKAIAWEGGLISLCYLARPLMLQSGAIKITTNPVSSNYQYIDFFYIITEIKQTSYITSNALKKMI